ncbi:MAG: DeoR family transcriptional regulator [Deltaproteobacteria bacterium]|jgi:DeoR family transcriptional regulator, glycerol-3-phosphate regulon repressor|nr:DeoR family transcriptional regulator [Deltaproteobacteria bacterium]
MKSKPEKKHSLPTNSLPGPERHRQIVALIQEQGYLSVEKLSKYFAVTTQTIRRDINKLCNQRLIERYHGGAGPVSNTKNIDYQTRQIICQNEKEKIAQLLVEHIPDHASVFLNIGTTTEEIAKALLNHNHLRVITNNLNVVRILNANDNIEVIIAGGVVRSYDNGITGDATIDFINQFKFDFGIIGISGIDEDGTLLDFDFNEVRVTRAIIEQSRKVFLAADHTKFGRNAMVCLTNIETIDALFTDQKPPQKICNKLKEADVDLYVAKEATG